MRNIKPALMIQPAPSSNYPLTIAYAGYARDETFFPVRYPQPSPGGYCKYFGSNCWWTPALVEPNCRVLSDANNNLQLESASCPTIGGNSGSPLIWDAGRPGAPAFRITGVIHGGTAAPAATRFMYAPRFASGVAVATASDGSPRTQVFASDSDLNQIVSRTRDGASITNNFAPFDLVGSNAPSPQHITAFKLTNNKPQVVMVSGDGNLYTTSVDNNNRWQAWSVMDKPSGVNGFLDIDSAYDANGVNQLYVIGSDHQPYTRRRLNNEPYAGWSAWQAMASPGGGDFDRISAVRRADGTQQVFLINTARRVYSLWQTSPTPNSTWSAPTRFADAGEPPAIVELAANLTEDSQVQVFAIDVQGGLWTRTMKTHLSSDGWNDWESWSAILFAPVAAKPPVLKDLVTLKGGRWQEPGEIVPVVFATDEQGNIYYTTHSKSQGWQPWHSFYQ